MGTPGESGRVGDSPPGPGWKVVVKVDEAGSEPTPMVEMPKWLQLHRGGFRGAGRLRDGVLNQAKAASAEIG